MLKTSTLLCGVGLILATVAAAATPIAVKATSRNELGPAADGEWIAWAKSRSRQTSPFDVWVRHGADPALKVNARKTQAYPGGIDGTRLVYQQIVGIDRADLRLYDLAQRRHTPLAAAVNTKRWECCATLSGEWLLFSRGSPQTLQMQLVVLRNLVTGEQRVLDRMRNAKGVLTAGQVSGTFAVWTRCSPHPRCQIRRHDIASRTTTNLGVPSGKVVYAPSVNPSGNAYYVRSGRGCGRSVELVKETILGVTQVLVTLPRGQDVEVTYADLVEPKDPRPTMTTRVYYDRVVCRRQSWDIFRVDDVELLQP